MATSMAALRAQFDLHTKLFNNVLDGITDADASTQHADSVNHMKWIAGHILNTRLNSLCKMAGIPHDASLALLFGKDAKLSADVAYPSMNEIKERWNTNAPLLAEALTHIPADKLAAKSPATVPINDDTVLGTLAFLVAHESHHIGQLSVLRKMLGKPAMSYN